MPLSDANIIQSNTGSYTATTGNNITLPAGTTAGNTVIVTIASVGGTNTFTGFTKDSPNASGNAKAEIWRKSNVGAGESSWAITQSVATANAWAAFKIAGLDADAPKDAAPSLFSTTTSQATWSTFTSGLNNRSTTYDALVIAAHGAHVATASPPTITSHTQGFTEQEEQSSVSGSVSIDLSASMLFTQQLGIWDVDATRSDGATGTFGATHVVYSSATAKRVPDVAVCFGAEIGTATGMGTTAQQSPVDAVVGSPAVIATSPRSGAYCLELSSTAAAENIQFTAAGSLGLTAPTGAIPSVVYSFALYFPTALPAADTVLVTQGVSDPMVLRFIVATGKLGLKLSTGTEQVSVNAVAADQWYQIDLRRLCPTTAHKGDWQIDGADQPQATFTAGSANCDANFWFGWTTALTATVRYDDIVITKRGGHYPLGVHNLLPLKVDPAGTLTISGTAANFQTYTNNGTLVAWNATTARNAIDDIPPTVGASADGFAQITAAGTNYVEVPMETSQAAPSGAIRGVRVYVCGWSPSATAQSFRVDSWDGSTAVTLYGAADPNFDNAATAWVCRMAHRTLNDTPPVWTQAMLDALALRLLFSAVAQDVGVQAVLGEAIVQQSATAEIIGESSAVLVELDVDPVTSGVLGATVTTPPNQGTTLNWTQDATPQSVAIPADTIHTEVFDAVDITSVTDIGVEGEAS